MDEPLDEVIVEGSENEAFEGEEAQPPPKNGIFDTRRLEELFFFSDEFKVVAPKIPADAEEVEPAGIMIQNIPQQGLISVYICQNEPICRLKTKKDSSVRKLQLSGMRSDFHQSGSS